MQKLRLDFWKQIREIPVEDLVFLDEAGVNLALIRLSARPKGYMFTVIRRCIL